jgi:hypothetical protein
VLNDEKARMGDRLEASRLLADRGWRKAPSLRPIEQDDPLEISGAREKLAARLARLVPLLDKEAEQAEGGT